MMEYATSSTLDARSESRAAHLDAPWRAPEVWDEMYARLAEFRRREGHTRVPRDYPADRQLAIWVRRQAYLGRNGQLWRDWECRLTALGFEFDFQEVEAVDAVYAQLVAFRARHGQSRLEALLADDPQVAKWLRRQHLLAARGKLPAACRERLEQLGVVFKKPPPHPDDIWEEMYARLVAFHQEHGHARVPTEFAEDRQLGSWVSTQRRLANRGDLLPRRSARLAELAFEFKLRESLNWEEMYARLVAFHQQHGHTRVPADFAADRKLGNWVNRQRWQAKRGDLLPPQRVRLEELAFEFTLKEMPTWEQSYARLAAFHKLHGHVRLGARSGADRRLAGWATRQRTLAASGKLRPERRAQLERIGFVFALRSRRWGEMLQAPLADAREHGDTSVRTITSATATDSGSG